MSTLFAKLFVEHKKNVVLLSILFLILMVTTLGLVWIVFYDEIIERKGHNFSPWLLIVRQQNRTPFNNFVYNLF